MICSSVVTCPCPDEPQSLEGPETLSQATYHLPAVIGTGFLNMIGYFCLAPHSYVIFSDSQRRSPSPSCSPPSVPISNSFILPTYSPLPPKSPNPPISISVSTENLTASMLCPLQPHPPPCESNLLTMEKSSFENAFELPALLLSYTVCVRFQLDYLLQCQDKKVNLMLFEILRQGILE